MMASNQPSTGLWRLVPSLFALCFVLFTLCSLPLSAEILSVDVSWDVEDEPLNIGDMIHFKVTTDGPGSVIVDISTVHQSIQLYDDGTNGDAVAGDHGYELDYSIFEGDTVEEGPILVHFVPDDGKAERTGAEDDITPRITIDGTRPLITNDGIFPSPFNPHEEFAYIRYILTESAAVSIKVYAADGQLIRTLGTPSGRPGENHTTWNGVDDEGNVMPDGTYTYEIAARDGAGNDAVASRGGCILTTVYLEIDNSVVAPNPFSPDGDNVDDITWFSFDVKAYATEEQLASLGFGAENLITASTEDDNDISPFGLVGITIMDSSGVSRKVFSHDLTHEADTDPAPNGWPNGKMPPDVPPGSNNFFGLPNGLPDFADENLGNDWDVLLPLHGPFESDEGPYYQGSLAVGWDATGTPDGTYLIGLECELVGRTWEFADYMKSSTGLIIGEKWHAVPARHHGVTAFPRTKSAIVARGETVPVDDDPPIVNSTSPSDGSAIDPITERIEEISVVLDDGADGSGVDPVASSVSLLDPLGNKLSGQHVPFGINTIKLSLDSELTISGKYTITVVTADKRGNKSQEPLSYSFTVEDTSAPTVVPNTIQPRPTDFDSEGIPIEPYTQPIDQISIILTDGLTGSGVDLEKSILYVKDSVDETVEGELIVDEENKKLTYAPQERLAASGTYTIVVVAVDHASTKGIYTYEFVLDMAENIVVRHEGKTYLVIYASTTALNEEQIDLSGITAAETEDFPAMVTELVSLSGFAVKVDPHDIELSQDADLTLYYDDSQVSLGVKEEDLSIYAFKTQARDWVQLPNVELLAEENRLKVSTSYIDQYYAIAYTRTIVASAAAEVSLDPPKFFSPEKDLLRFTFANDVTDYKVEVYNTAGDRIVVLEEQGRSDSSLGWDGRNEDSELVRNGVFICRILYNVGGQSKSQNRLIAVIK